MGLAERRLAEKVKTEEYTPFLKEFHNITKSQIPVDMDWASFTAYNEYSLTRIKSNIFDPLIDAFKHICQDQLGKDAVAEGIKSISYYNVDDLEKRNFSFDNKEIKVWVPLAPDAYSNYSYDELIKLIEVKL